MVTGGAGVVGSHVVDRLVEAGAAEVAVLDALTRGSPENLEAAVATGRVRLVPGDIADRDLVSDVVRGADVVFHQAAIRITQCAEDPRLAHHVMVDGTFEVFDAAVRAGVERVVFASSASVYGDAEGDLSEDRPALDTTMYSVAKRYGEMLLEMLRATAGLRSVVLRYFNVYGPRMSIVGPHTEVLVKWMERIESGQPPLILGDGSQTMDFVHVGDIARANVLAATSERAEGVYNIGTGTGTSLAELARELAAVMGSELEPEHAPARSVNSVARRVAIVERAARDLGFRADTDLGSGLASLVAWWRARRASSPSQPLEAEVR